MLTLSSYPSLFGVADNNPFGLEVYAFLRLCGIAFAIYGFVANMWLYDIDTPLKAFLSACPHVVAHCEAIHAAVGTAAS